MPKANEIVIYTVEIIDSNIGAWYRNLAGETFDTVLENYFPPFGHPNGIVMFKVIGAKSDFVCMIRQEHCHIISQRFGSHKDLMKLPCQI